MGSFWPPKCQNFAYIHEQNESDEDDNLEILFVNDEKDEAE